MPGKTTAWPKYNSPPDMLSAESKLKTMKLTNEQLNELYLAMIDAELAAAETKEERKAWAQVKIQRKSQIMIKRLEEAFVEDFCLWLVGRSKYSVVEREERKVVPSKTSAFKMRIERELKKYTPWGNKPLTFLPGVPELLEGPIMNRDVVIRTLTKLKATGPKNINEAWIYYKYLIRGVGIDGDVVKESSFFADYDYTDKPPMVIGGPPLPPGAPPGAVPLTPDPRFPPGSADHPAPPRFDPAVYRECRRRVGEMAVAGDPEMLHSDVFGMISPEDKIFYLAIYRLKYRGVLRRELEADADMADLAAEMIGAVDADMADLPPVRDPAAEPLGRRDRERADMRGVAAGIRGLGGKLDRIIRSTTATSTGVGALRTEIRRAGDATAAHLGRIGTAVGGMGDPLRVIAATVGDIDIGLDALLAKFAPEGDAHVTIRGALRDLGRAGGLPRDDDDEDEDEDDDDAGRRAAPPPPPAADDGREARERREREEAEGRARREREEREGRERREREEREGRERRERTERERAERERTERERREREERARVERETREREAKRLRKEEKRVAKERARVAREREIETLRQENERRTRVARDAAKRAAKDLATQEKERRKAERVVQKIERKKQLHDADIRARTESENRIREEMRTAVTNLNGSMRQNVIDIVNAAKADAPPEQRQAIGEAERQAKEQRKAHKLQIKNDRLAAKQTRNAQKQEEARVRAETEAYNRQVAIERDNRVRADFQEALNQTRATASAAIDALNNQLQEAIRNRNNDGGNNEENDRRVTELENRIRQQQDENLRNVREAQERHKQEIERIAAENERANQDRARAEKEQADAEKNRRKLEKQKAETERTERERQIREQELQQVAKALGEQSQRQIQEVQEAAQRELLNLQRVADEREQNNRATQERLKVLEKQENDARAEAQRQSQRVDEMARAAEAEQNRLRQQVEEYEKKVAGIQQKIEQDALSSYEEDDEEEDNSHEATSESAAESSSAPSEEVKNEAKEEEEEEEKKQEKSESKEESKQEKSESKEEEDEEEDEEEETTGDTSSMEEALTTMPKPTPKRPRAERPQTKLPGGMATFKRIIEEVSKNVERDIGRVKGNKSEAQKNIQSAPFLHSAAPMLVRQHLNYAYSEMVEKINEELLDANKRRGVEFPPLLKRNEETGQMLPNDEEWDVENTRTAFESIFPAKEGEPQDVKHRWAEKMSDLAGDLMTNTLLAYRTPMGMEFLNALDTDKRTTHQTVGAVSEALMRVSSLFHDVNDPDDIGIHRRQKKNVVKHLLDLGMYMDSVHKEENNPKVGGRKLFDYNPERSSNEQDMSVLSRLGHMRALGLIRTVDLYDKRSDDGAHWEAPVPVGGEGGEDTWENTPLSQEMQNDLDDLNYNFAKFMIQQHQTLYSRYTTGNRMIQPADSNKLFVDILDAEEKFRGEDVHPGIKEYYNVLRDTVNKSNTPLAAYQAEYPLMLGIGNPAGFERTRRATEIYRQAYDKQLTQNMGDHEKVISNLADYLSDRKELRLSKPAIKSLGNFLKYDFGGRLRNILNKTDIDKISTEEDIQYITRNNKNRTVAGDIPEELIVDKQAGRSQPLLDYIKDKERAANAANDPQFSELAYAIRSKLFALRGEDELDKTTLAFIDMQTAASHTLTSGNNTSYHVHPMMEELVPFMEENNITPILLFEAAMDKNAPGLYNLYHGRGAKNVLKRIKHTWEYMRDDESPTVAMKSKIDSMRHNNEIHEDFGLDDNVDTIFLTGNGHRFADAKKYYSHDQARFLKKTIRHPQDLYNQIMAANPDIINPPVVEPRRQKNNLKQISDKIQTMKNNKFRMQPKSANEPVRTEEDVTTLVAREREALSRLKEIEKQSALEEMRNNIQTASEQSGLDPVIAAEVFKNTFTQDTPIESYIDRASDPTIKKFILNMADKLDQRLATTYRQATERPKTTINKQFQLKTPEEGAHEMEYMETLETSAKAQEVLTPEPYIYGILEQLAQGLQQGPMSDDQFDLISNVMERQFGFIDENNQKFEQATDAQMIFQDLKDYNAELRRAQRIKDYALLEDVQKIDYAIENYFSTRSVMEVLNAGEYIPGLRGQGVEVATFNAKMNNENKRHELLKEIEEIAGTLNSNPGAPFAPAKRRLTQIRSELDNLLVQNIPLYPGRLDEKQREEESLKLIPGTREFLSESRELLYKTRAATALTYELQEAIKNRALELTPEEQKLMQEVMIGTTELQQMLVAKFQEEGRGDTTAGDSKDEYEREARAMESLNRDRGMLVAGINDILSNVMKYPEDEDLREALNEQQRNLQVLDSKLKAERLKYAERKVNPLTVLMRGIEDHAFNQIADSRLHRIWQQTANRVTEVSRQMHAKKREGRNASGLHDLSFKAAQKAIQGLTEEFYGFKFPDDKPEIKNAMHDTLRNLHGDKTDEEYGAAIKGIIETPLEKIEKIWSFVHADKGGEVGGRPAKRVRPPAPRTALKHSAIKGPSKFKKDPTYENDDYFARVFLQTINHNITNNLPYQSPYVPFISTGNRLADISAQKPFFKASSPSKDMMLNIVDYVSRPVNNKLRTALSDFVSSRKREIGDIASAFLANEKEGTFSHAVFDNMRTFLSQLNINKNKLAKSYLSPMYAIKKDKLMEQALQNTKFKQLFDYDKPYDKMSSLMDIQRSFHSINVGEDYRPDIQINSRTGKYPIAERASEYVLKEQTNKFIKSAITTDLLQKASTTSTAFWTKLDGLPNIDIPGLVDPNSSRYVAQTNEPDRAIQANNAMNIALAGVMLPISTNDEHYTPLLHLIRSSIAFYSNSLAIHTQPEPHAFYTASRLHPSIPLVNDFKAIVNNLGVVIDPTLATFIDSPFGGFDKLYNQHREIFMETFIERFGIAKGVEYATSMSILETDKRRIAGPANNAKMWAAMATYNKIAYGVHAVSQELLRKTLESSVAQLADEATGKPQKDRLKQLAETARGMARTTEMLSLTLSRLCGPAVAEEFPARIREMESMLEDRLAYMRFINTPSELNPGRESVGMQTFSTYELGSNMAAGMLTAIISSFVLSANHILGDLTLLTTKGAADVDPRTNAGQGKDPYDAYLKAFKEYDSPPPLPPFPENPPPLPDGAPSARPPRAQARPAQPPPMVQGKIPPPVPMGEDLMGMSPGTPPAPATPPAQVPLPDVPTPATQVPLPGDDEEQPIPVGERAALRQIPPSPEGSPARQPPPEPAALGYDPGTPTNNLSSPEYREIGAALRIALDAPAGDGDRALNQKIGQEQGPDLANRAREALNALRQPPAPPPQADPAIAPDSFSPKNVTPPPPESPLRNLKRTRDKQPGDEYTTLKTGSKKMMTAEDRKRLNANFAAQVRQDLAQRQQNALDPTDMEILENLPPLDSPSPFSSPASSPGYASGSSSGYASSEYEDSGSEYSPNSSPNINTPSPKKTDEFTEQIELMKDLQRMKHIFDNRSAILSTNPSARHVQYEDSDSDSFLEVLNYKKDPNDQAEWDAAEARLLGGARSQAQEENEYPDTAAALNVGGFPEDVVNMDDIVGLMSGDIDNTIQTFDMFTDETEEIRSTYQEQAQRVPAPPAAVAPDVPIPPQSPASDDDTNVVFSTPVETAYTKLKKKAANAQMPYSYLPKELKLEKKTTPPVRQSARLAARKPIPEIPKRGRGGKR